MRIQHVNSVIRPLKKQPFSLTNEEAQYLKINPGIDRARQIIRSNRLGKEDTKRVTAFYSSPRYFLFSSNKSNKK